MSDTARTSAPCLMLGIESSCDETAAAIVQRTPDGRGQILANRIATQFDDHAAYGGVVPEIAARAHVERLTPLIAAALDEAGLTLAGLDGIAAAAGPGLIGGLLVGSVTARVLALAHELPYVAVNHLAAHALTPGLTNGIAPPYLLLLVSGGHTQLLIVHEAGRYTRLGTTLDDALGEAFDKTAKLLGLPHPGGPHVEQRARHGDARRFELPRPMLGRAEPHFSFSGLKTAVRRAALRLPVVTQQDIDDLCAGFQAAVIDVMCDRVRQAMTLYEQNEQTRSAPRRLVLAGGVAANQAIRAAFDELVRVAGYELIVPPPALCTDNAAMIGWAGAQLLAQGVSSPLDAPVRARWPLDPAAPPAIGAGVKA